MNGPDIIDFSVESTEIDGLLLITQKQVTDKRGTIREAFRTSAYGDLGDFGPWTQINVTSTSRGAIRGLHGEAMTKLIGCAAGTAYGVYLDAREGSATRGRVVQLELRPGTQVLVPPGVCNGFQALTDDCLYLYCFDQEWRPDMTGVAFAPLDPGLGIDWPISVDAADRLLVSAKDAAAPCFSGVSDAPAEH